MWDNIKNSGRPVVLYGTGNAADKIIKICEEKNINIAGIFASDDFVRSRNFAGYPVISYSEAKRQFGHMTVLLCFGSHIDSVMDNIKRIDYEQDLYAPDLPIAGDDMFTEDYFESNREEFLKAFHLLSDRHSRDVFSGVINYKLTGRLSYLTDVESDDEDNYRLFNLGSDEAFIDLGAYNGDTIDFFLKMTGGCYRRIIAFEPEKRNFRKLNEYCEAKGLKDALLLNAAASDADKTLYFEKGRGRGSQSGGIKTVPVDAKSVDNVTASLEGDARISFIKMDLEGMEEEAIRGASQTIKKDKPKMLISAYHRSSDLFAIPRLVMSLNPGYRVYLRHSPCIPAWEVNYYFV